MENTPDFRVFSGFIQSEFSGHDITLDDRRIEGRKKGMQPSRQHPLFHIKQGSLELAILSTDPDLDSIEVKHITADTFFEVKQNMTFIRVRVTQ